MLALRMEAVGLHPFHASAVRYRGQDGPVPRRRVEPRQVDGPDRGLPSRRRSSSRPRRRSSTSRAWRSWARRRRSSRSAPRAPSAPTRRRRNAASRSSSARMPTLGDPRGAEQRRRRRRPRDRRQLRPVVRRDDPVRAAVPDVPLAPELLPDQRAARAGLPDAGGRHGRAARRRGRTSCERFAERPYFFVRAATPQVLLDEVDRVL